MLVEKNFIQSQKNQRTL